MFGVLAPAAWRYSLHPPRLGRMYAGRGLKLILQIVAMTAIGLSPSLIALMMLTIFCAEIEGLASQIERAAQEKDEKKTEALTQKIDELEKQLGPEYPALFELLDEADPNSKDVQDILSMFDRLDESCPH